MVKFEKVAGPYKGATGGLAWDGKAMFFAAVGEEAIYRFDPASGKAELYRRWTFRTNGLAMGADGVLYGGQEGGRRVIRFLPDGITTPTALQLDGRYHNFPCDLAVDRGGRVWFTDPYNPVPAMGPQMYPLLEHQSVLRMEETRGGWTLERMTFDTVGPRALALSADEKTLFVADARELRAYPVNEDGKLGPYRLLHAFGGDHRGPHRGIEGLCLDAAGNLVACAGWKKSGPGPLVYVFTPEGRILETHELPCDLPMRVAFGGDNLSALYLTTGEGAVYCARP